MVRRVQQFSNRPDMIRESRRRCWRFAVGAVNPAEIEVRGLERDGVLMVFEFLGKAQCLAGKPPVE